MMNFKSRLRVWALALGVMGAAGTGMGLSLSSAVAQAQPRAPSSPGEARPSWQPPMTPEERRGRIRMVRMWRLIDVLDLKEGQSEKFFLTLKRYDAEEDRLNIERERLSTALRGMITRPETPEKALLDTMQAVRQQDDLLREARVRFRTEASNILSVRQQAKLMLFEQRFDLAIREAIMDVLGRRGERGEGWGTPERWRERWGPSGEPPSGPPSR